MHSTAFFLLEWELKVDQNVSLMQTSVLKLSTNSYSCSALYGKEVAVFKEFGCDATIAVKGQFGTIFAIMSV